MWGEYGVILDGVEDDVGDRIKPTIAVASLQEGPVEAGAQKSRREAGDCLEVEPMDPIQKQPLHGELMVDPELMANLIRERHPHSRSLEPFYGITHGFVRVCSKMLAFCRYLGEVHSVVCLQEGVNLFQTRRQHE